MNLSSDEKATETIKIIRKAFRTDDFIPLHEPRFIGNEKEYLNRCIDSTFVSYLGKFVSDLETKICSFTGTKYCITTSNGTSALHVAMVGAGVQPGTEVVTQPLTFVATVAAIKYCQAEPTFVDIDKENLGMSSESLKRFFEKETKLIDGSCVNKKTGKKISAIVPVHIFGHPARISEIIKIAQDYRIPVVEDAAESLGSYVDGKHTGSFGKVGTLSFNGNKIVTCGGGGAIITNDEECYKKIKHLTTTAKVPHRWEYIHDEVGFNYRMPNLNAAVALAQFENLEKFLENKRDLAIYYTDKFKNIGVEFIQEPKNTKSNYWLNALLLKDQQERNLFLEKLNSAGVMSRPAWELMFLLEPYKKSFVFESHISEELGSRLINIPSSVRNKI